MGLGGGAGKRRAGGVLVLGAALYAAAALQAGRRGPDGRSMAEILGRDPEESTWEDLCRLSRREAMRLFYAAPAPRLEELRGFYEGRMPRGGLLNAAAARLADLLLPTGRPTPGTAWLGVDFEPGGMNEGRGRIVYRDPRSGKAARGLEALTFTGPSNICSAPSASLYLDYSALNRGVFRFLHDEVRRVNGGLFICAGCLSLGETLRLPLPFTLHMGSSHGVSP